MFKIFLSLFLALLFSGCFGGTPLPGNKKAFEEEDAAIEAEKKKKAGIRKKDLESFQNLPIPGYRAMPQI